MIKRICYLVVIASCFSFSMFKEKEFLPPGTVKINDTLFADQTEVSNQAWQEYEYWTIKNFGAGSKQHLAMLPDSLVWHKQGYYDDMYMQYYYRHEAYAKYPVVGISYGQVLAYCSWRTDRVKDYLLAKKKKVADIQYRLPNKREWEFFSQGDEFLNAGKNAKGEFKFNCYHPEDTVQQGVSKSGEGDVTAPVYSYWENKYGLYNTIGNVSEMLLEKGICKGGSWRYTFENCRPEKDMPYSGPESWIGFRCVCVVKL